jgi:hypothetical protein
MKATTAVSILTIYLVVCTALSQTGFSLIILSCLFLIAPFLIVWMVYVVLKDDQYKYPELNKDDEWGYRDKTKDQLGVF